MTGNMEVHADGRVASHGSFGTVVGNVSYTRGRWYYEVVLESSGLLQIGWATDKFQADSNQGQVWAMVAFFCEPCSIYFLRLSSSLFLQSMLHSHTCK